MRKKFLPLNRLILGQVIRTRPDRVCRRQRLVYQFFSSVEVVIRPNDREALQEPLDSSCSSASAFYDLPRANNNKWMTEITKYRLNKRRNWRSAVAMKTLTLWCWREGSNLRLYAELVNWPTLSSYPALSDQMIRLLFARVSIVSIHEVFCQCHRQHERHTVTMLSCGYFPVSRLIWKRFIYRF